MSIDYWVEKEMVLTARIRNLILEIEQSARKAKKYYTTAQFIQTHQDQRSSQEQVAISDR